MLQSFKFSKRDSSSSKGRISSADISGPTPDSANLMHHVRSSPSREVSYGSKHLSIARSHMSNISSPEKVIKALYNYRAQSANELSFLEGEFFYVEDEERDWFKASNPTTGKIGMVPKNYFESFDRSRPLSTNGTTPSRTDSSDRSKTRSLYAIVLYDFQAEKADELTVYVGENLFICAHHNHEWFIAKPIGRLGGPGLVPVDFVSIIDISTGYATGNDIRADIDSVYLPTVQEWKNNVTKYKNSNITLGSVGYREEKPPQSMEQDVYSITFDSEFIKKASIDSFALEDEKYWFTLSCELSTGKARKLKRYYQDFYDLQVKLLDTFPSESGKLRDNTGQWTKRIMPYIPGPVPYVTDTITKKRKEDLNVYVSDLTKLPEYISRSDLVKKLFTIKNNGFDYEYVTGSTSYEDNSTSNVTSVPRNNNSTKAGASLNSNTNNTYNEDNTLTGDDLKLYHKMGNLSLNSSKSKSRPPSTLPPPIKPTKIKFNYNDDIFALMLSSNISLSELRSKIAPRVDGIDFQLQVKLPSNDVEVVNTDLQVSQIIERKLKITVIDI